MAWTGGVTNAGTNLLSGWASGSTTLYVTRAACGTGTDSNPQTKTAMANEVRNITIAGVKNTGSTSGVRYQLKIFPAADAVTVTQIGLFAKLGTNGTETLLALFQNTEGTPIPSSEDMPAFVHVFYAYLGMSNQGSLSVSIDENSLVTQNDLDQNVLKFSESQTLTTAQQTQALSNLGAGKFHSISFDYGGSQDPGYLIRNFLALVTEEGRYCISGSFLGYPGGYDAICSRRPFGNGYGVSGTVFAYNSLGKELTWNFTYRSADDTIRLAYGGGVENVTGKFTFASNRGTIKQNTVVRSGNVVYIALLFNNSLSVAQSEEIPISFSVTENGLAVAQGNMGMTSREALPRAGIVPNLITLYAKADNFGNVLSAGNDTWIYVNYMCVGY